MFAPSGKENETEAPGNSGFNVNVPEPTTAKLVDKKTAAYEKQQAEVEEESRMKSLEQLAGTLMNEGKGASDTGEKEKDGDRLQQSVNTYEQISGQLNDFYETPKETANSDLERKVDELNKKLEEAEKEKNKAATREELMERSYKMAAKYLNPDKDTVQEKAVGKEPTETVPVQRAEYQTTSGLSQPVTDSAYIASLTVERNYGFNTAVGNSYQMGTNTIAACIPENQIIEQGGRVKLRLLQPLQAGNITVPENSLVTGAAVIQGERLDILISSIEYAGNIIPVQLATYDIDGQKGIFVPGSETRNAAKDAAGTVSESMGNSVSFARSAGQQVVMDLTRGVMQGGTRLIAGRVRAVKVTLKAGYKVLLVTKRQ
ncbi:conjugative transposon protein TraM [Bacteroides ovatus]|nr:MULTISPECIES: conjugative transposon protein TraM [Bacteroides]EEO57536.1 conjugative transposon TraM protein [Bacteroides sp. 2_2_4]MBT9936564.1 conjugative transposon protein TraM [Bacteroides ovatus]MCE8935813.1 conjugative transposon protein TraM [Bacteroides ovatus]MCS3240238.1 conjugative transposon protein TraM [Bacteroides ovatus]MDC2393985.1 conjugative transposon protein TraM [Bacteroides ovatus]